MSATTPTDATQPFLLRLWKDEAEGHDAQWRGKVQRVLEGEVHYFEDFDTLIALLLAMLEETAEIDNR